MPGQLLVERLDDIAHLVLSNPGKRNALDPPLLSALAAALSELERDGVRAGVLSGQGEAAFSAGYDIEALPEAPTDEWLLDHGPLGPALRAVGRFPLVAALNGVAIGSGCELALTCDLRVAHPEVVLQMPPVRMGLVYTPAGIARLVSLCGAGRAREMLLCAGAIDAGRALSWGLCDRLVPREQVLDTALGLAREIARGAPLAVRGTKQVLELLFAEGPELAASAARVLDLRRRAWYSADASEARQAFLQRRPPRFRGE